MHRRLGVAACCAAVIALAACGKGDDKNGSASGSSTPLATPKRPPKPKLSIPVSGEQTRDSCPPLTVTLDGKPLTLPHSLSKRVYGTPSVILYAEPVTCEDFMKAESTTYGVPHVSVGIGVTNKGRVSVGSSRGGTALVNRVQAPAKPGDTMALCIPKAVEFVPLHATMKGRLRVHGLVEAKHCGDIARSK